MVKKSEDGAPGESARCKMSLPSQNIQQLRRLERGRTEQQQHRWDSKSLVENIPNSTETLPRAFERMKNDYDMIPVGGQQEVQSKYLRQKNLAVSRNIAQ